MRKVLILPKWYPNKFDILDGIFVLDHIQAIAISNDVFVLFVHSDPDLKTSTEYEFTEHENFNELKVYFKIKKTGIGLIDKIRTGLRYIRVQKEAYAFVHEQWGTPDFCHIHVLLRASFLARRLKKKRDIPYFITEHWSGYDPFVNYKIGPIKRWWLNKIIRNSSGISAVSSYLKGHIQKYSDHPNFQVISNAVNQNSFQPDGHEVGDVKSLIHVSTLDDYPKNFGNLLKCIAAIKKSNSNFVLNVYGKGIEKEKQINLAKDLGLEDVVIFHGYIPKTEIAERIAASDLMLLHSHYETQSCVLLESFMCGVPVVAPAIGGVSEIVTPQNGLLIEHLNDLQFQQAVISFLENRVEFDSNEIRKMALQYDYKAINKKFEEFFVTV